MARKNYKLIKMLLFSLLLLLPSLVGAQNQEYKDYTIEKGDTLWNIADKELKDHFLWPKVWKENPDIKNPDLIFPKQKIKIPLYLLQKEVIPVPKSEPKPVPTVQRKPEIQAQVVKPEVKVIQPIKREHLIDKNALIASGFIADEVHSIGKITDALNNKNLIAKGDHVFINTVNPVKKGDRFYILHSAGKIPHPKSGRNLGYLIEILGIAEVIDPSKNDPQILITDSFAEITPGDLLDTYYEIDPPFAPEKPRKPDIDGVIVSTKRLHFINGTWDIVYLDTGKKDGLEVGDILATTLQSEHKIIHGLIQIITLRGSTATAVVRKNNLEITTGDGVTGAKQE
jgi:hypothetical protein